MEMIGDTFRAPRGLLALSCLFSLSASLFAQGGGVKIENESLEATVTPAANGKVISFKEKGGGETAHFKNDASDFLWGLGKHRSYESQNYFKDEFKVAGSDKNSVTLKGNHERIEVVKTFTLPPGKKHLKIEIVFRDTIPLADKLEISPWLHNTIRISETPADNIFYLPHDGGLMINAAEDAASKAMIKSASNWTAYIDRKAGKGMMLVSETPPKGVYYWCNPREKIGTLEMLFPTTVAVPKLRMTYYLAPVSSVDAEGFAATGVPVKANPPLPGKGKEPKSAARDSVTMAQLYEKAPEKSEPLEARLWQPALVVSPDAVYPYALGLKGNIAGKNPIFVIDVPEGVEMVAWSDKYWWGKDKAELLRTEKIKRENGNYTRHTFAVSLGFAQPWLHSYFRLFFKTAKTSGPVQPLYYRTGQDGNLFTEKSAPVEIVRIPQSKVPKRFVSMMGCDYEMMKKYPDCQNNLRRMGVNGVCLNYNVLREGLATVEEVRAMNHGMKKDGFVTATMGAGFFGPPETKELSAVDINGKTTHNFDFTARGPFMDQAAERMCKLGGQPEFDILISDYEAYFNGYNLSFTERTLSKFKSYFEQKHKNLKYVDPKTVTLQKREHPEHYKIWVEWKSSQFFEYMSEIASKVRAKHPKMKIGFCTTPGVSDWQCKEVYLQDNRLWNNTFLDYNVTMLYNNLYSTMHNCRAEMDTMGGMAEGTKAMFFPALTFGFWSEIEYKFPPEDSRHIIYEAVTSGAKGYWVFPGFVGSNGWHYAEMALANRVIAENEDTLLDGRRADGLVKKIYAKRADGGAVGIKPKVLVLKNKAVVYLAEYSGKEISGEAVLDLPFECKARDAETGEELGKVGNDGVLKFKFGGKVKARMFVLEGPEGGEFPKDVKKSAANTADSPALDEASLVFYDSFDTEPLKGGMIDNYQIFSSLGGVKNNCLKVTDYRGGCVYNESIKLKSGNATIDLWHTPGRDFGKGSKTEFTVLRVTAGGDYQIWLGFNGADGKLRLVARKDGKYLWESSLRSKIDSWTNSWYNIRVSFGDKGAALWVNGELQAENKAKWPALTELTKVQLGATWRTFGLFDELKIYDMGLEGGGN